MDQFELLAYKRGAKVVAGVDEAGRGPLAGPVVAAAVILPQGYKNSDIKDSKQMTARQRDAVHDLIREHALSVGVGVVEAAVIDRVNILRATWMAMGDALAALSIPPDFVLVDGNQRIPIAVSQESLVKGDRLSISIAAASIIAKVSRDRIMEMYHRQFPCYHFSKNKGYGTAQHRSALRQHGPCKIHRLSFHCAESGKASLNEEFDFISHD
ncbi:MAG: ribonuclease HII [Deltaproteobacteria bacterium]|jgi:ribonuclease HII|nr:ribonuclease HII [Deltaproteobacteria bacterium]